LVTFFQKSNCFPSFLKYFPSFNVAVQHFALPSPSSIPYALYLLKEKQMPKRSSAFAWPTVNFASMAMQSAMLAIESQQVIAMRLTQMALGGPGVQKEAELMVSEKIESMAEVGQMMMMATLGGAHDMGAGKAMQHYRTKVRANRRRLGGA
jgi:hypothetical protein